VFLMLKLLLLHAFLDDKLPFLSRVTSVLMFFLEIETDLRELCNKVGHLELGQSLHDLGKMGLVDVSCIE
jgi:hypothetical protein